MRKYESTSGLKATMTSVDSSRNFYFGSHVRVEVIGENCRVVNTFGSYAEGFEWLVKNFGCGWTRVRG